MRIIIGEPKEIAAYELALKDGEKMSETQKAYERIKGFSHACDALRKQTTVSE